MKFLLFFISLVFSIIFYIFNNLSYWRDIFWKKISNSVNLESFSNNLLIESFIFIFIWIVFLYIFSWTKNKWESRILNYKYEILYFIFYIIFVTNLYFLNFQIDYIILLAIIFFILSDVLFNHLSNIKAFSNNKSNIRYTWLFLNYFSIGVSFYYIFQYWLTVELALILVFNIFFNYLIHKKYINYISLFISILIILFLFYSLYFWLFELYILYI